MAGSKCFYHNLSEGLCNEAGMWLENVSEEWREIKGFVFFLCSFLHSPETASNVKRANPKIYLLCSFTSQAEHPGRSVVHCPIWVAPLWMLPLRGLFWEELFWLCMCFWQNVNGASESAQTRDHSWISWSAVLLFTKLQTAWSSVLSGSIQNARRHLSDSITG